LWFRAKIMDLHPEDPLETYVSYRWHEGNTNGQYCSNAQHCTLNVGKSNSYIGERMTSKRSLLTVYTIPLGPPWHIATNSAEASFNGGPMHLPARVRRKG